LRLIRINKTTFFIKTIFKLRKIISIDKVLLWVYIHNRGGNNKKGRSSSLTIINHNKIMPKLDGTGPMGQGPKTGRGLGPCVGGMRRGWGCFGGGFGFRRFASPKNELIALEEDEKMLEEELSAIREEKAALKDQQK
jgi:hypothetical protein